MEKCVFEITQDPLDNASINVKPEEGEGGGTPGICGAFDFSEEFLVNIPTVGPQNWVKSDQMSPPFPSIYIENE